MVRLSVGGEIRRFQNMKQLDINQSIKINEFVSLFSCSVIHQDLMENSSILNP